MWSRERITEKSEEITANKWECKSESEGGDAAERERERAIINNGWQVKQYEMKSHKPVKIIDESGI